MKFAEITLNSDTCLKIPTFTYQIPENLILKPGDSVLVPFKKQIIEGIVVSLHNNQPKYPTKKIVKKTKNLLFPYQINLAKFISDYYFCDIYKVIKLFLPKKIWNRSFELKNSSSNHHSNTEERTNSGFEKTKKSIVNILSQTKPVLFKEGNFNKKIDIYFKIAAQNITNNEQTLIIFPEILTIQPFFQKFQKHFGEKVAIYHNKLSESEKLSQHLLTKQNKTQIIIGTKLALFLPFFNLNTVIIDSEHEKLYKNEQHPKYDARTLALQLHKYFNLPLILQSPAPRLETYHQALQKKFVTLKVKTPNMKPNIEIINLNDEVQRKNFSIFSEFLTKKIENCLQNKNQVILTVNKLGSSNTIFCKDCNHTEKCENCNINLKLDQKKHLLFCSHCSFKKEIPTKCPKCQSTIIKFKGIGTQKIEAEVKKLFPNAKIFRADRETSTKKHFEEELYEKLKNHEIDILIGTQIVTKNLNLPNIKLVCNLLVDIGSNIPDFRNQEYYYQSINNLLYSINEGNIIIQTYNPKNPILKSAITEDFHNFALQELETRKNLSLPPFTNQIKISTLEDSEDKAEQQALNLQNELQNLLKNFKQEKNSIEITNYPAFLPKKNNKYIWQTLISSNTPLNEIIPNIPQQKNTKIDIDPVSQ